MTRKFAPTKHGARPAGRSVGASIVIGCRDVGCGGTNVTMRATADGVRCVWTNENTPSGRHDGNDEAADGSNVSVIPWAEFQAMAAHAPKGRP